MVRVIREGGAVIFMDPKGDFQTQQTLKLACEYAGRPEAYLFFHPAFPGKSARIDPLAQWSRSTEIATRLVDVMPAENDSGGDAWSNFAWRTLNIVVQGMRICDMNPNLKSIKRYVEGGIKELLAQTLQIYLNDNIENWRQRIKPYMSVDSVPRTFAGDKELFAMVSFYKKDVQAEGGAHEALNGMINMFEHDSQHYSKMIQNLLPTLEMLTADSLGGLLSPEKSADDKRRIVTGKKIIADGLCCYIGLDSLPDRNVSGAIGSIILSDLASVAGDLYNTSESSNAADRKPIYLYVEEMNEVANMPMVNLLNKSRGAGFIVTAATQTFSDLVVRLGDEPKARMALGNFNNLIALRSIDGDTQELITETFGTTMIMTTMHEQKTVAIGSDRDFTNFSGGYGERLIETPDTDVFPQELLAQLPDLEYMARVSGGEVIKGRVPILKPDAEDLLMLKQLTLDEEKDESDRSDQPVVDMDTRTLAKWGVVDPEQTPNTEEDQIDNETLEAWGIGASKPKPTAQKEKEKSANV